MYQGLLGTFPFTVTELEVSTFRDLKFSREQVYAEHRVLAGIPCLQHMGRNLDPVSLTVQIVPLTPVSTVGLRLRLLESVAASGDEMALVIGLKYYGLYVLKSYEITHRQLHYGDSWRNNRGDKSGITRDEPGHTGKTLCNFIAWDENGKGGRSLPFFVSAKQVTGRYWSAFFCPSMRRFTSAWVAVSTTLT